MNFKHQLRSPYAHTHTKSSFLQRNFALSFSILMLALFFTACSTDESYVVPPDDVKALTALPQTSTFNLIQNELRISSDEPAELAGPDPETDCRCFMNVLSVENYPTDIDWGLVDVSQAGGSSDFEVNGNGNFYYDAGLLKPLPSGLIEFSYGPNGFNMFYFAHFEPNNNVDPNFTINTQTTCYLEHPDGTLTTANVFDQKFIWSEATQTLGGPGGFYYGSFWKYYTCLPHEEDVERD